MKKPHKKALYSTYTIKILIVLQLFIWEIRDCFFFLPFGWQETL